MQHIGQRRQRLERLADHRGKLALADRVEKFIEVKRIQPKRTLLRGNDDPLHVPTDGDKGSGLDVVIAAIGNKLFDEFSSRREPLNLIENDNRFATR